MKKIVTVLAVVFVLAAILTGCAATELNFGKKLVKTEDMITILTEISSGTADVGIMDSIMANYYMSQDTNYADKLMLIDGLVLAEEEYGIAARKAANSTIYNINKALVELKKNGSADEIAARYGLTNDLIIDEEYNAGENTATDDDWSTIVTSGKIKIGYTVFAPIAYKDADGNFIGFDIDLAKAVAAYYGIEAQFVEIEWGKKEFELNSYNIDLIWNGMTITDERKETMNISIPYLMNNQVAVIRKADKDKYTSTESMSDAIIAAESGSAGQSVVEKAKK
ncbi:MAG TPA: transporter substrate-binding domain-containing protein [Clostridia bacterium]|jgi:ABC-type amino acid transport substrate-binding protein|nr:transporter substrate-binding domain-containing protein [Clostridia bacterium]